MRRSFAGRQRRAASRTAVWLACCLLQACATSARADERLPLDVHILDQLPYGQQPVDYHSRQADNAVERLNQRLESGKTTLKQEGQHGYLKSLLDELDVPVCSQLLVFSKTAVSQQLVGPRTPRAVYFNDDVYIAWVPDAPAIEVAAFDRYKGAVFYQLRQEPGHAPRLVRESRCLGCHVGDATLQVPGLLSRSILTDAHGNPLADQLSAGTRSAQGSGRFARQPPVLSVEAVETRSRRNRPPPLTLSNVAHETPFPQRWAGWYVTGTSGRLGHLGNTILSRAPTEPDDGRSFRTLPVDPQKMLDVSRYPLPGSDAVAHLIFNHQVHGQNLMARVLYEARLNRRSDAQERLVRYLLLADEALLDGLDISWSPYARWFESRYSADSPQGAVRQLDLKGRVFKHRLSYLVDTPAFQALPRRVKRRLSDRIEGVLANAADAEDSADIPAAERQYLVTILRSLTADRGGRSSESPAGRPQPKRARQ